MKVFKVKAPVIKVKGYLEVHRLARNHYEKIKLKSKRIPYVRSAYFEKEKIFLNLFWNHLYEKKNFRDKIRRLRFFLCALELIEKSKNSPNSRINPLKSNEILHRFVGLTEENVLFAVQIKESKNTKKKYLISIFPFQQKKYSANL